MSQPITEDYLRTLLTDEEYAAAARPKVEPGEQGSIEWLMARCGYVTASRFADVMNFNKPRKGSLEPGKESEKRANYRKQVICERVTKTPMEHYVSQAMRNGTELEPMAKMAYEARTGRILRDHGFQKHATIPWVGGSPDSLIGERGGLECKCPTPPTHLDTLLNGMDPDEHYAQVQGLIWIFDAEWWDFCSYCPVFDEPLRTYIERIPRDDAYIEKLHTGVLVFLDEVDKQIAKLERIRESGLTLEAIG